MSAPVVTALRNHTVSEVRSLMENRGLHALPVVELDKALPTNKAKIVGIVTNTDLDEVAGDQPIESVMNDHIHILHKDSSAKSAANTMLRKNVHHLVVMDDGDIVGMVSSTDFVKLVAEHTLD